MKPINPILCFALTLILSSIDLKSQDVYTLKYERNINFNGELKYQRLQGFLPKTILNKQRVIDVRFYPEEPEIINQKKYSYYAFNFNGSKANKITRIVIEFDIELFKYDLAEARFIKNGLADTLNLGEYLESEAFEKKDHKLIQRTAQKIEGSTDEEIVKNIYDLVIDTLVYDNKLRENLGAVRALKKGKGDCTEYSDLMVTLCRAKGIPARVILGMYMKSGINVYHNWVETYLRGIGWVPFDPTHGDRPDNEVYFENMKKRYVYLCTGRTNKKFGSSAGRYSWASYGNTVYDLDIQFTTDRSYQKIFRAAFDHYKQNNYDSTLLILNDLIEWDINNTQYLGFKAMSLAKMDNQEANKIFQIAIGKAKHAQQKRDLYYAYGNYHALIGNLEYSISFLRGAMELGFRYYDHMVNDEDLDSIRDTDEFRNLLLEYGYKMKD